MQKSGGGLIRKPIQNMIKKVGQKMSRRRNSANPSGLKKLLLPGGGKISPMHNPLLPKGAQQLEGLTSQHLGSALKQGGESYGQKRKLATTQAEARRGSIVKKPPPMPFPFMNFRPQMLEEVFSDSIEFGLLSRKFGQDLSRKIQQDFYVRNSLKLAEEARKRIRAKMKKMPTKVKKRK